MKSAPKLEFARLVCLSGEATDAPPIVYDQTTGLIPPSLPVLLDQIKALEEKLGLPADSTLTPMQRAKRIEAAIELRQPRPLSARAKPARPVRWTDSKGRSQVDLAAIFDREAVC